MSLKRHIDTILENHFKVNKEIIALLGARQVGKTTALKRFFPDAQYLLVDNETTKEKLERYDITSYKELINPNSEYLIIDEIHLLSNPGRAAKIIFDQVSGIKMIITGSSSLYLKNRTAESLAGRKYDYNIYPLTFSEYLYQKEIRKEFDFKVMKNILEGNMKEKISFIDIEGILENVLVYGLYPHMINSPNNEDYLKNLAESVIFKDLLELNSIENRTLAISLLRLIAYQIGSLTNIFELSNRLGATTTTINKYLSIFEQSFIIFSLPPYSKVGRDEIGKMKKYYFYDTGLRNALIGDFNSVYSRADKGALFENFLISEILKENYYSGERFNLNFWRTKQGSEIDLVLSRGEELIGIEIKLGDGNANIAFKNRYKNAQVYTLTPKNFF